VIEDPQTHVGHPYLVKIREAEQELQPPVTLLWEVDLVAAVPAGPHDLPEQMGYGLTVEITDQRRYLSDEVMRANERKCVI
jgi:hypothetical protein